jgi:hypothetical protein
VDRIIALLRAGLAAQGNAAPLDPEQLVGG